MRMKNTKVEVGGRTRYCGKLNTAVKQYGGGASGIQIQASYLAAFPCPPIRRLAQPRGSDRGSIVITTKNDPLPWAGSLAFPPLIESSSCECASKQPVAFDTMKSSGVTAPAGSPLMFVPSTITLA